MLVNLAFWGGLISSALGIGGGIIYNPVLLSLGLPPMVAGASGMVLVTFSKFATTFIFLIYHQLNIAYGFWLAFWTTTATIIAMFAGHWYTRMSGRQSFIVWAVVLTFVIGIAIVLAIGSLYVIDAQKQGLSLTTIGTICTRNIK